MDATSQQRQKKEVVFLDPADGSHSAEAATMVGCKLGAGALEMWLETQIEGKRSGRQRMKWLDGIIDSVLNELEQTPGDSEGQGSLACCSSWSHSN